ncbi:EXS-domain-containing protein [Microthyrium microscopicum]|uniref:EXS-domain-containing protein n=1 Tax=Microthyrium microscopicum TaxID=703497 RepID=A0A6A6UI96_9PEZI|nr:EXS-domain-containing protein [Microthyrium microscopicum]
MDGDPSVEPELDSFSLYLPLPYRVALIIVLGVWAWGVNLHYLHLMNIDVPSLIRYPSRNTNSAPPIYLSCYRLASLLTTPLAALLLLFWAVTRGNPEAVRSWEIIPNLYLLILVVCFCLPFHIISGSGRQRFLTTLKRISVGGIAEAQDGKFGDILMADALTSYAKVIGDLFVSLCLFFSRGKSSTGHPDRSCGGSFIVPIILAIPSLIRFRQCLIEYSRVRRRNWKPGNNSDDVAAWNHMANAVKYASAFPVIIMSAIQRSHEGSTTVFRLWLFFVVINSAYSFYWDVAKDWDLTLFSARYKDPEHPLGLRYHRYFEVKELYYFVIVLDLLLRFTWSIKLSVHLDRFNDMEGGIFLLELLEVFRRWVWVFFRVETEWVRTHRGPAPDDILLGDMPNTKIDDD